MGSWLISTRSRQILDLLLWQILRTVIMSIMSVIMSVIMRTVIMLSLLSSVSIVNEAMKRVSSLESRLRTALSFRSQVFCFRCAARFSARRRQRWGGEGGGQGLYGPEGVTGLYGPEVVLDVLLVQKEDQGLAWLGKFSSTFSDFWRRFLIQLLHLFFYVQLYGLAWVRHSVRLTIIVNVHLNIFAEYFLICHHSHIKHRVHTVHLVSFCQRNWERLALTVFLYRRACLRVCFSQHEVLTSFLWSG